jgi:hypothetical protein
MKTILFGRALLLITGLALTSGPTATHAQVATQSTAHAKAQAAMRTKAWNSITLMKILDAKGEHLPFDFLAGVAILSNGSVVFGDQYESRIVLADSAGRLVAVVGRKGGGPGEFEARSRILRLRGDSIGVYDGRLRRLSIFDAKLKFARTELIAGLPGTTGMLSAAGQFADGSMVMVHQPFMRFTAADGVYDVQPILYVSNRDGAVWQFNLPRSRELQVRVGNSGSTSKVPMTSVRGVSVCENGFVTVADGRIDVYDASSTHIVTPPYHGRVDTLSSAERTQLLQVHSGGYGNAPLAEKVRKALDAEQPRRMVRYSAPVVSADGVLWFRTGDEAEGRFLRTTLRGVIIDTLYAPYQILHADKRISMASGPFSMEEGQEAPLVIVRQKAAEAQRKPSPPSPLGRCNALVTY